MTKLRQTLQISHFDVIRALRYCLGLLNAVACCLLTTFKCLQYFLKYFTCISSQGLQCELLA